MMGVEHQFVQPHHLSFAEGSDLQLFAGGFPHNIPQDEGGPGRCVFLMLVVALEDLS